MGNVWDSGGFLDRLQMDVRGLLLGNSTMGHGKPMLCVRIGTHSAGGGAEQRGAVVPPFMQHSLEVHFVGS